jgi:hypothetical protein
MSGTGGTPYAPHTDSETAEMLSAIGVDDEEALFDIPESVAFDGEFGIEPRSEREIRAECSRIFARNDDLTEFLGRGHYGHYVPSVVDHLADRAEFLTSYTQYQPEISQGFLQALFEYQSMLVELTGLPVANCSMYDAATALGEAATLAHRVRSTSGVTVLVPEHLREGKRAVLSNYCAGADLTVESYPMADGNADVEALADRVGDDTVMVYAENPTVRGCIEERLAAIGDLADETDALFALGSDVVALSVLESPAAVGADVVGRDGRVRDPPERLRKHPAFDIVFHVAADDRLLYIDVDDGSGIDRPGVLRENRDVREFARLERAFLFLVEAQVRRLGAVKAERVIDGHALIRTDRFIRHRSTGHGRLETDSGIAGGDRPIPVGGRRDAPFLERPNGVRPRHAVLPPVDPVPRDVPPRKLIEDETHTPSRSIRSSCSGFVRPACSIRKRWSSSGSSDASNASRM